MKPELVRRGCRAEKSGYSKHNHDISMDHRNLSQVQQIKKLKQKKRLKS